MERWMEGPEENGAGRKERENERWNGGWKDRRRMEKDKEKDCRIERGIKDLKKDWLNQKMQ